MGAVTIGVTVMILLTVFLFIAYASFNQNQPKITLPSEDSTSDVLTPGGDGETGDVVTKVEITPDTVQNVIATLQRPEAYARTITVTTFWSGGSSDVLVNAYVSDGLVRMDTLFPGGQTRHTLRNGGETHIWYNSERSVYTIPTGDFSADDEQWIPTYEDLLDTDKAIAEAGYESYQEIACIYAATEEDGEGYAERYWVAVDSGLLVAAQRLQNGETVYRMEALTVTVGEPESKAFTLPDGTVLGKAE